MTSSQPEFTLLKSNIGLIKLGTEEEKVVILTEARLTALEKLINEAKEKNLSGLIFAGSSLKMFSAGCRYKSYRLHRNSYSR